MILQKQEKKDSNSMRKQLSEREPKGACEKKVSCSKSQQDGRSATLKSDRKSAAGDNPNPEAEKVRQKDHQKNPPNRKKFEEILESEQGGEEQAVQAEAAFQQNPPSKPDSSQESKLANPSNKDVVSGQVPSFAKDPSSKADPIISSLPHVLGDLVIQIGSGEAPPSVTIQKPSDEDLSRYQKVLQGLIPAGLIKVETDHPISTLTEIEGNRNFQMKTRFNGKKSVVTGSGGAGSEGGFHSKRFSQPEEALKNFKANQHHDDLAEGSQGTRDPKMQRNHSQSTRAEPVQKVKKTANELFEETVKLYQNMYTFDWDLKDIQSSRHPPRDELSTGAFWFNMNCTFFPNDIQFRLCDQSFEDWYEPIKHNLEHFEAENEDMADPSESNPTNSLLGKRKKIDRFAHYFRRLSQRAEAHTFPDDEMIQIQENASKIPKRPLVEPFLSDYGMEADFEQKDELAQLKENRKFQRCEKMIRLAEADLEQLAKQNVATVRDLFESTRQKFEVARAKPVDASDYKDNKLYKPEEISQYGKDFLAYVDPQMVQDLFHNKEWYLENTSPFLQNFNYPCKLQTDFLKGLEIQQQQRNDLKYRKIMDQMEKMEKLQDKGLGAESEEIENGLKKLNQRAQKVQQDDACCQICGNGDYEDDDQIVFCSQCSIPVHQSCFGLETIPDHDFFCLCCDTFGFKRGLSLPCFLCPKRGGAMKPTNIFSSYENFYNQKIKNLSKKTGKNNIEKLNNLAAQQNKFQQAETEIDPNDQEPLAANKSIQLFKQQIEQRIETNSSLQELLKRERQYQTQITTDIQTERQNGQLSERSKNLMEIDNFQLNFTSNEKKHHDTPEDYNRFISRNELALEKQIPSSDSLYHWVHHSCSMWMQGPIVTPKTPVKMKRLDYQKFNVRCVICGQKGFNVGAAVKCFKNECSIYFHVECAKRENYCMEIEKKPGMNNRDRIFKIFCESHRPFKIITEINEHNDREIEGIIKFSRTIEKCLEIQSRYDIKPKKMVSKSEKNKLLRQALQMRKQQLIQQRKELKQSGRPKREKKEKPQKPKKWKEKDKKMLFDRIKEKYLLVRKMRLNLLKVNPNLAEQRRKEQRKLAKRKEKAKRKEEEESDGMECLETIEDIEPKMSQEYFKLSDTSKPMEIEWIVTLGRDDFPWREIRFGYFSAKECYSMYTSHVKNVVDFLKKILGDKPKFYKILQHQLMGQSPLSSLLAADLKKSEKRHKAAIDQPKMAIPRQDMGIMNQFQQQPGQLLLQDGEILEAWKFCMCKGAVQSDFMVACENGEDNCPNSGWVHPQCAEDLRNMTQEQIDQLDVWYCPDCKNASGEKADQFRVKNEDAHMEDNEEYGQVKKQAAQINEEGPINTNILEIRDDIPSANRGNSQNSQSRARKSSQAGKNSRSARNSTVKDDDTEIKDSQVIAQPQDRIPTKDLDESRLSFLQDENSQSKNKTENAEISDSQRKVLEEIVSQFLQQHQQQQQNRQTVDIIQYLLSGPQTSLGPELFQLGLSGPQRLDMLLGQSQRQIQQQNMYGQLNSLGQPSNVVTTQQQDHLINLFSQLQQQRQQQHQQQQLQQEMLQSQTSILGNGNQLPGAGQQLSLHQAFSNNLQMTPSSLQPSQPVLPSSNLSQSGLSYSSASLQQQQQLLRQRQGRFMQQSEDLLSKLKKPPPQ